jgi:uncharacterized repeat protein (TIGR03803 family)
VFFGSELKSKTSFSKRRITVARPWQSCSCILENSRRTAAAGLAVAFLLTAVAIQAQTYNVIHNFSGGQDGATPMAGLTIDPAGNFYGTAAYGGNLGGACGVIGCGTVFRLANRNSGWVFSPLYSFAGGTDGANPEANVNIGSDGTVYGSTYLGGGPCDGDGCGTIFHLKPPASACKSALCPWTETTIHNFTGPDGIGPVGAVIFDQGGNLFGATTSGGFRDGGAVFELLPMGGEWTVKVLYSSYGYPRGGLILDGSGNLYGPAFTAGSGYGSVYQMVPSGSSWITSDLYDFTYGSDGGYPWAGLIFDQAGNLYGSTCAGGSGSGGTVFQLTLSGGKWVLNTLYSFTGPGNGRIVVGPVGSLVMDQAGTLYGTTLADGAHGYGSVFKLTPGGGGWTYTSLHEFTGGSDGGYPYSNLVFDAKGNLYGTASAGGTGPCTNGCGVIFEITP